MAVKLALDTNCYIELCRGAPEVMSPVKHAQLVVLPFIVVAELRAGFSCGRRGRDNERILSRFLAKPGIEIAYADEQTTHHYARLYRQLREQGTPIPTNDLWIAAVAAQHNLTLFTRDKHFAHLPQLDRFRP